jgi:carbon-monoxide dehydrogenase small subunit
LPKQLITLTVNGQTREIAVEPSWTLLETVREQLRLTGAKEGCGTGDCGACSMLVDGRLVTSCLMLAVQADGREVTTIEGLATNGSLHPVQAAFVEKGGVQCGFCTPGMIMAAASLLERNPSPTLDEVREGLAGNLCRCTGYTKIYESVLAAAEAIPSAARHGAQGEP